MATRTIGELISDGAIRAVQDGNHGEKHPTSADYVDRDGVPFVMARDFPSGRLDLRGVTLLRRDVADKLRIGFARPGDVLLTHKGTVGATGIVPGGFEYIMLTPQVTYYRTDPAKLNHRYLQCAFCAPEFQDQLRSISAQSTRPFVAISTQRSLRIPVPSLPVQRRIAGILSAYDDLIENCERRIRILDEMARALYREWFVDFRYPGHERTPMVDTAMGRIPKGWRMDTASSVLHEIRRGVAKGALQAGVVRYLGLEHIPRRSLALDAWEETSELGSNKLRFEPGEILFGKIRPYFHKVAVAAFPGICSADTFVLSVTSPELRAFGVCLASSDEFVAHATATSNGAKMPRANWEVMGRFNVAMPPSALLQLFSPFVDACIAEQQVLVGRVQNLRATRDLLLPRLLSGDLAIERTP